MAWSSVESYALGFRTTDQQFFFYYTLSGEQVTHQIFVSADEMAALADMFRNEGPVSYNSDGDYFVTNAELVGEGETVDTSTAR
jgi:hypothetical protein